jgi:sec-independent protein translocase protein TatA
MFNIGPSEFILILVLALVIFGPNKCAEMGRTLGTGLRDFKRASQDITSQFTSVLDLSESETKDSSSVKTSENQIITENHDQLNND